MSATATIAKGSPALELVAQAEYILMDCLKNKTVKVDSAMAIMGKAMEIMERFKYLDGAHKKTLLRELLTRVAAGADGVIGTADDLIPAETLAQLHQILDSGLLDQTVELVMDITHGRFSINKAVEVAKTAAPACIGCIGRLSRK